MSVTGPWVKDLGIPSWTQLQWNRNGLRHRKIGVGEARHRCTNQEDEVGTSESQLPRVVVAGGLALSPKLVVSCFP